MRVTSWNVNGLTAQKKQSSDFTNLISQSDIIFLFETWTNKDSDIRLSGYTSHNFYRKFQHRKARRNSGGTVIYYRDHLKPGITVVRNHYDTVIWLRLSHDFFGFERDVYICGMYIWGEDSPAYNFVNVDFFDLLQADIDEYENCGYVYLVGDWNSRVGRKSDFIAYDQYNNLTDDEDYTPDCYMQRATMDSACNNFGVKLLDLCKSSGVRIVKWTII